MDVGEREGSQSGCLLMTFGCAGFMTKNELVVPATRGGSQDNHSTKAWCHPAVMMTDLSCKCDHLRQAVKISIIEAKGTASTFASGGSRLVFDSFGKPAFIPEVKCDHCHVYLGFIHNGEKN